jgi:hypothetical protein
MQAEDLLKKAYELLQKSYQALASEDIHFQLSVYKEIEDFELFNGHEIEKIIG